MRRLLTIFLLLFLFSFSGKAQFSSLTPKKVSFASTDGLLITADLYLAGDTLPYMVLCHQAGYSRGEYAATAKKFCHLGFNCLAVDLRSGKEVNGVVNETAARAIQQKKPVDYLEAEQDIVAAIDYAHAESKKKVFLVGSSYSASLVLKIAASDERVSGVMAFSPGEYFGKKLKVSQAIANCTVPVFIASAKSEAKDASALITDVKSKVKVQFVPTTEGRHGSSCLWKDNPGYREYWLEILMFVRKRS